MAQVPDGAEGANELERMGVGYCSARDISDEVAAATERNRVFEISCDLFAVAAFEGYLKSIIPRGR